MHCFTAPPHKSCTSRLTKNTNHALLHCLATLITRCHTQKPISRTTSLPQHTYHAMLKYRTATTHTFLSKGTIHSLLRRLNTHVMHGLNFWLHKSSLASLPAYRTRASDTHSTHALLHCLTTQGCKSCSTARLQTVLYLSTSSIYSSVASPRTDPLPGNHINDPALHRVSSQMARYSSRQNGRLAARRPPRAAAILRGRHAARHTLFARCHHAPPGRLPGNTDVCREEETRMWRVFQPATLSCLFITFSQRSVRVSWY